MGLLENEKVREFFGCEAVGCRSLELATHDWLSCLSYRVLASMSERIEKGTKVLASDQNGDHCEWKERVVGDEAGMLFNATQEFHPGYLVLPARFQPQCPPSRCEHGCPTCVGEFNDYKSRAEKAESKLEHSQALLALAREALGKINEVNEPAYYCSWMKCQEMAKDALEKTK